MESYKSNKKILTDEPNIEIKVEKEKPDIPTFYAPSQIQEVKQKSIEETLVPIQLMTEKKPQISNTFLEKPAIMPIPSPQPTVQRDNELNTFIISYPRNVTQHLDYEQKLIYTGTHISSSVCKKYDLHNMPYILLIINKKYKIPIELSKTNENFYSHKRNKGPIFTSSITVELFDYMNNPLNLTLSPTEIFHILFETTT
jgi:hypothetical protein